jgi:hypothetical protein
MFRSLDESSEVSSLNTNYQGKNQLYWRLLLMYTGEESSSRLYHRLYATLYNADSS